MQRLKTPNRMTQDELNIERKVSMEELKELQHTTSYLWVCHLQQRRSAVLAKGDIDKAKVLLELRKRNGKSNVGGECEM